MAAYRSITTMRGLCPFPWEDVNSLDGKVQDRLNPMFSALYVCAIRNALETCCFTTATCFALAYWCDGEGDNWSIALIAAYALVVAVGNLVYIVCYSIAPYLRLFGFWLRGYWSTGGMLMYCGLRALDMIGPRLWGFDSLLVCTVGMCVFWSLFLREHTKVVTLIPKFW